MNTKQFTISILKEARADENRTPFTPDQVKILIANFPNMKILVQPSKKRCFKDEEYSIFFTLSFFLKILFKVKS